jgi:hypothetical protein
MVSFNQVSLARGIESLHCLYCAVVRLSQLTEQRLGDRGCVELGESMKLWAGGVAMFIVISGCG